MSKLCIYPVAERIHRFGALMPCAWRLQPGLEHRVPQQADIAVGGADRPIQHDAGDRDGIGSGCPLQGSLVGFQVLGAVEAREITFEQEVDEVRPSRSSSSASSGVTSSGGALSVGGRRRRRGFRSTKNLLGDPLPFRRCQRSKRSATPVPAGLPRRPKGPGRRTDPRCRFWQRCVGRGHLVFLEQVVLDEVVLDLGTEE